MSTSRVQNCKFEFECPGDFSLLAETADPLVRFCSRCSSPVYRCNSLHELAQHSQAGHCVVLSVTPCNPQNTRPGQRVLITSGTFENFYAEIESVDAENASAKIMIRVFGRVTPIDVPLDVLAHEPK